MFKILIYKKKKRFPWFEFQYEDKKKGMEVFEKTINQYNSNLRLIRIENLAIDKQEINYILFK